MPKYIEIMLPDAPLQEGVVEYFDDKPRELKRLNNKEFVIVPVEVYTKIHNKVVVIHRSFFDSLPEELGVEETVKASDLVEQAKPKKTTRTKKVEK